MCLIAIAYRCHDEYPLLVAANRDEFHDRPTQVSASWQDIPHLIAGRDLSAGGTWMGVTRQGRFAAITNHRNPPTTPEQPRSRGFLTLDYLAGDEGPEEYLQRLKPEAGNYAGFNLLLGDAQTLWCFSNIDGKSIELAAGVYSLSNASLDSSWPKQQLARREMQALLDSDITHESLQATVSNRAAVPDSQLPDTGVGQEMERLLAPQFIVDESYGTRATTSLHIDHSGAIGWRENSYNRFGQFTQSSPWQLSPDARE